jgi:hypothetical protein
MRRYMEHNMGVGLRSLMIIHMTIDCALEPLHVLCQQNVD